jgi:hypothetical protein
VKDKQTWDELIDVIIVICGKLLDKTSSEPHIKSVQIRILASMFRKGVDTLRAIQLLYRADLPIQAQALIRILFEIRLDMALFLRLCAEDPVAAVSKVLDTMMLQKIPQQRQSDFRGLDLVAGAPTPEQLLSDQNILIRKYGKGIATKMQNNGFTGFSVEVRAQQLGLSEIYNIVYRNFSRNIHNTDYMEHLGPRPTDPDRWKQYEDVRDHVALSTAIACAWRAAWFVDSLLGGEVIDPLIQCWKNCVAFEHRTHWPELMEGTPSSASAPV